MYYRFDKESRVKIAELEKVSVATIDREIKELKEKWGGRTKQVIGFQY